MDYDVNLTEFNNLAEMLLQANIPYENVNFYPLGNGRQIIIYKKDNNNVKLCDAVCHFGSYGHEQGLLEIMGGLTIEEAQEDEVLGWLTAEEVFERFKYCYEHNTNYFLRNDVVKNN